MTYQIFLAILSYITGVILLLLAIFSEHDVATFILSGLWFLAGSLWVWAYREWKKIK